jgi:hypothetical protein
MEIRKSTLARLAILLYLLTVVTPVGAQSDQNLTLLLSRDFGYSSGTGRIQGAFSLTASGADDLERVVFKIDDQIIGEADQPPFRLRFSTSNYPLGVHTLTATGFTSSGQSIESDLIRVEFVSADEGWQTAAKIAIPIVGIVFSIMLATFVLPFLFGSGKRAQLPAGARRSYGISGGAICPKCSRPFAMHVFGLNLVVGKLDRCPYCGKWSLVRRSSIQELHAAEAAELEALSSEPSLPDASEEDLRRQIDESRYL